MVLFLAWLLRSIKFELFVYSLCCICTKVASFTCCLNRIFFLKLLIDFRTYSES
jgi:hypothetical protein